MIDATNVNLIKLNGTVTDIVREFKTLNRNIDKLIKTQKEITETLKTLIDKEKFLSSDN